MRRIAFHNNKPVVSRRHPLLVFVPSSHSKVVNARYLVPVFLFVFAFSAINTFAQDAPENPAAEKMAELEWLIGKWKFDYTLEHNGTDLSLEMECSWTLQKSLIQCDRLHEEGIIGNRTLYSYDSFSSRYVVNIFDGRGQVGQGEMMKDGNNWNTSTSGFLAYQDEKASIVMQEQYAMKTKSSLEVVRYASMNAAPPTKLYEGEMTKID